MSTELGSGEEEGSLIEFGGRGGGGGGSMGGMQDAEKMK